MQVLISSILADISEHHIDREDLVKSTVNSGNLGWSLLNIHYQKQVYGMIFKMHVTFGSIFLLYLHWPVTV